MDVPGIGRDSDLRLARRLHGVAPVDLVTVGIDVVAQARGLDRAPSELGGNVSKHVELATVGLGDLVRIETRKKYQAAHDVRWPARSD